MSFVVTYAQRPEVEMSLPMRTASESNMRDAHWSSRHRRTKVYRGATKLKVQSELNRRGIKGLPRLVAIKRFGPQLLDEPDNLGTALKGVKDGVADALGIKDNDKRVTWRLTQEQSKRYAVHIDMWFGPGPGEHAR